MKRLGNQRENGPDYDSLGVLVMEPFSLVLVSGWVLELECVPPT